MLLLVMFFVVFVVVDFTEVYLRWHGPRHRLVRQNQSEQPAVRPTQYLSRLGAKMSPALAEMFLCLGTGISHRRFTKMGCYL